jgi:hypothetical protein
MSVIRIFLIVTLLGFTCMSLAAEDVQKKQPAPANAAKIVEMADIGIIITLRSKDGTTKEFKLLIVDSNEKALVLKSAGELGLKTASSEEAKALRQIGRKAMVACITGNYIIVEIPPKK